MQSNLCTLKGGKGLYGDVYFERGIGVYGDCIRIISGSCLGSGFPRVGVPLLRPLNG